MEEKDTSVDVGKGGVNGDAGKGNPDGETNEDGTNVGVGKGGVNVRTRGRNGRPVYVGVTPSQNPFDYRYTASEDQLHDNPNVSLFFLEKDIRRGTTMSLQFTRSSKNGAAFLSRQVSESIPFSSSAFQEILNRFSVNPRSEEAEVMKKTIQGCEEPAIGGEDKYCATSLESMIDFSRSKMGKRKRVRAISTEVEKETKMQKYRVEKVKKMEGSEDGAVVCHKQNYPYAVFYCHKSETTRAYMVSMVGGDGTKAVAVAVCHSDTSAWNPKHLAFQVLGVRPGEVPVCHFLPEDHIVWIGN